MLKKALAGTKNYLYNKSLLRKPGQAFYLQDDFEKRLLLPIFPEFIR